MAWRWTQSADTGVQYRSASILKNCRVVFNIKGNAHRLAAALAYNTGRVLVKFIGTHKVCLPHSCRHSRPGTGRWRRLFRCRRSSSAWNRRA